MEARVNQETYEKIIQEFDSKMKRVLGKVLLVNFDVVNALSPVEALREPIEEWLVVRRKLNRRGLGAFLNFRDPNNPVIATFVLTGNERTDMGQSPNENPFDDIPDENPSNSQPAQGLVFSIYTIYIFMPNMRSTF